MPMPRRWTHINDRVFNPAELSRGNRPVLTHTGRTSGAAYRTLLDAHSVDGQDIELTAARVISAPGAWQAFGDDVKGTPGFLRLDEYLRMDRVTETV